MIISVKREWSATPASPCSADPPLPGGGHPQGPRFLGLDTMALLGIETRIAGEQRREFPRAVALRKEASDGANLGSVLGFIWCWRHRP